MSEIYYNSDGTQSIQTRLTEDASGSIRPVDIQSRYATTIQTHTGALITPSGNSYGNYASSWIDCDGFSDIAFTTLNDAGVASIVDVQWSNDGSTYHGGESFGSSTSQNRAHSTAIKARYARVKITNSDAAGHTFNSWALLKA